MLNKWKQCDDLCKNPARGLSMSVATGDVPADVLHPAHVVVVPVCDHDLLDAGVELLQRLFEPADVFWHSRLSSVNQHSAGIQSHTFTSENWGMLWHMH